jgi:hypothetical protein
MGNMRCEFAGIGNAFLSDPSRVADSFHPSSQIQLGRTMKKAALLLSGLLLSAFVSGTASAEVVRVRLTARVLNVSDASNVLAGKIAFGQRLNGLYVYNTNTPNQSPLPFQGVYRPYANEARIRFAAGSLVFESKQPTQGINIFIQPHNTGNGLFQIESNDNKPLADGATVDNIFLLFQGNGNVTESVALPDVAPLLTNYNREVTINGGSAQGFYSFRAIIEIAELIETAAIVVTPASGTFAANQHFDAAVLLPRNSVVQSAQATANGFWLPLSYPGSCQLQPQIGAGKPSLLCPGADSVLNNQPGAPIEWTVELTNGTIFTETVNWERAP